MVSCKGNKISCPVCKRQHSANRDCSEAFQFMMESIDNYSYRWWNLDKEGNSIGTGEIELIEDIDEPRTIDTAYAWKKERICPNCGTTFIKKCAYQLYHDPECARSARKKRDMEKRSDGRKTKS